MGDSEPIGLDATLLETAGAAPERGATKPGLNLTMRTTVLPRLATNAAGTTDAPNNAPRFEPLRVLGRGGVGEVTLARDNDIDRAVAVKRLRADVQSSDVLF